MAEHANLAPDSTPIAQKVPAEHGRRTRVHRQQPGEDFEHARLARAVRAAQMHNLAFANFQTSSCEEGEPAGERYGLVETNSRRHEDRPCYGAAGTLVTREADGEPAAAPHRSRQPHPAPLGHEAAGRPAVRKPGGAAGRGRRRPSSR